MCSNIPQYPCIYILQLKKQSNFHYFNTYKKNGGKDICLEGNLKIFQEPELNRTLNN